MGLSLEVLGALPEGDVPGRRKSRSRLDKKLRREREGLERG